jgi:hypothetical protein
MFSYQDICQLSLCHTIHLTNKNTQKKSLVTNILKDIQSVCSKARFYTVPSDRNRIYISSESLWKLQVAWSSFVLIEVKEETCRTGHSNWNTDIWLFVRQERLLQFVAPLRYGYVLSTHQWSKEGLHHVNRWHQNTNVPRIVTTHSTQSLSRQHISQNFISEVSASVF